MEERQLKIIVGLGNPGQAYENTRHNVGFMAADAIAAHLGAGEWKEKFGAKIASARIGQTPVLIVKPQTYMNLSGEAVGQIARWHKTGAEDILAIYDDMDIPVGAAKLKKRGSSGGHRGAQSLIAHLGTEEFARARVGIGRPAPNRTVIDHVLQKFSPEETEKIAAVISALQSAVDCVLTEGMERAMSKFSFKPKKEKTEETP